MTPLFHMDMSFQIYKRFKSPPTCSRSALSGQLTCKQVFNGHANFQTLPFFSCTRLCSCTFDNTQKKRSTCGRMSWRSSSGFEPFARLPSHTEALLVAVETPNASIRYLILVFLLLWQLVDNTRPVLPVDFPLVDISADVSQWLE